MRFFTSTHRQCLSISGLSFSISINSFLTCSFLKILSSFSRFRRSTMNSLKSPSRSRTFSIALKRSSFANRCTKSVKDDFPCRLADSMRARKSSRFCRILLRFSRRSSSARSLTYFSKTCLRSLDVSSKYLGSKTILCNSFSHVLKAETSFSLSISLNDLTRMSSGTRARSREALTSASMAASLPMSPRFRSLLFVPTMVTSSSILTFFVGVSSLSSLESDSERFFGDSAAFCLVSSLAAATLSAPLDTLLASCSGGVDTALSTSARSRRSSGRSHTDVLVEGL
uniref:Uncharacterized protein n=1 Tax=Lutzomyia longipalpis TaxID=7200 RepID=A0A7G3B6X4_LUTLO